MMDTSKEFYEARWRQALSESPMRKRRLQDVDPIRRWNKRAGDFAERTSDRQNGDKRTQTINWLKETGALSAGATVLDIGAGPGNWAMPLARECSRVVALEPASAMIDILNSRTGDAGIGNITVHQSTWQAIDLDALGWRGRFDLVFASMTPGVDGPEMLYKMMAACKPGRGFCYLSAFAGRSWGEWYGDLWRRLFDEELAGHVNDIIHPFNLVYALGYRPQMHFDHWSREIAWSKEKAVRDFTTQLENYTPITDSVRAVIADHVDIRSKDGLFNDNRDGCRGMMLWSMGQKVPGKKESPE
jgi:2-polyprenyl-3-methyl-5-hydroxy-6-metoxy-1,4-benzoquinol methylase